LYPDSTCHSSCGLQYTPRSEPEGNYCDAICSKDQYMFWNGVCIDSCNSPMRLLTNVSGTFCYLPCDNIQYYYYPNQKTCKSACDNGIPSIANNMYLVCETDDEIILSKLLHHVRYVDVRFPTKLANISIMRGINILSPRVIRSMFIKVTNWPDRFSLPAEVFEYYSMPSSFLANFGDDLILLGIILTFVIIAFLLEMLFASMNYPGPEKFFNRFRIMIQWNLPIMIIAQNTGDIFFFAILEFRTIDLTNKAKPYLSLSLAVIMLILVIAIYTLGILLAQKYFKIKHESQMNDNYSDFLNKWEKYQVLFRGYESKNLFTQCFFLIYCFRWTFPMIMASSLYVFPLLQTISFFVITTSMLIYILWVKPIKKRIDWINLVLVEIFVLLIDASFMGLAILDMKEGMSIDARNYFADVIIVCDYCIYFLPLLFLVIKAISIIRIALDYQKKNNFKQEKSTWLQLFFLPLQQGNFGFEQFQVATFIDENITTPQEDTVLNSDRSVSEFKRLHSSTSIVSQTTVPDMNNTSRLGLESSIGPRRRISPFQPRKMNENSLENDPNSIYYAETKANEKIIISQNSMTMRRTEFWTEEELSQFRPGVPRRQIINHAFTPESSSLGRMPSRISQIPSIANTIQSWSQRDLASGQSHRSHIIQEENQDF